MTGQSRLLALAAGTAGLIGILGVVVWDPDFPADLVFRSLALGGLWGLSEVKLAARERDPRFRAARVRAIRSFNRAMFGPLIALVVVAPLIINLASEWGVISQSSLWNAERGVMLALGLLIASTGNHVPKLISPFRSDNEPFDWQTDRRITGWSMCLSGVALATAAFLPRPAMEFVAVGSVAVMFGSIAFGLVRRLRRSEGSAR